MIELSRQHVRLAATPTSKDAAIREVAALLSAAGNVAPEYVDGMLKRETQANTYLGSGIAIPHGVPEGRDLIHRTGIAVLQVPQGVAWGDSGDRARLIVGIAAKSDEHLDILRRLTRVLSDDALVERLSTTPNPDELIEALTGTRPAPQASAAPQATGSATDLPFAADVTLPNPLGLHARPATALSTLVKSRGARVRVRLGDTGADATRLMEMLTLGAKKGSVLTVSADSEATLQAVLDAVRSGLGDDLSASAATPAARREPEWVPQQVAATIEGVPASGGLVVGVTRQHAARALTVTDTPGEAVQDATRLDDAWKAAHAELDALHDDVLGRFGPERAAIFRAHQELLADDGLLQDTVARVLDGHGPEYAWKAATDERIAALQRLDDPTLAARAVDLSDVQGRVLRRLLGIQETAVRSGESVVLLAPDLTPSDTARLDPTEILGFTTAQGGPTSHTAIIARGLGLPAVVAAGAGLQDIPDGTTCILDGDAGRLYLSPSPKDIRAAQDRRAAQLRDQQAAHEARQEPARTSDGRMIEVAANINRASDAAAALDAGAQGVGLMRTEFLFLERSSVPSEDEQEREYRAMAQALGDRPLVIRTLDIGGDKEVPYLGLAREDNSFLGIRGIRLCFERPDLFLPQLRAVYRAARDHANIHLMFPMISTLEDFRRAQAIAESVRAELGAPQVPLGLMIEVPSAALIADELAREAAFFSIGTNDLTGYTLAMDRQHPLLARQADAMHPAVLRLIDMTVQAAERHGKWVGVCGGAAGDDLGALILTGLGVKELSVSTPQIAGVKAALRAHSYADLQALAQAALACQTAQDVRALR